mgnify:CR=1 FL=1
MLKVAAIGLASALVAMQLKQVKTEYSNYIALAAGIIIFSFTLSKLDVITETIISIRVFMQYLPGCRI